MNNSTDIQQRINEALPKLSRSERRVAEVILNDVEHATSASNQEIAIQAEVSEPTVTRFCRTLGCKGVRDFKIQLAKSIANNLFDRSGYSSPTTDTLVSKVFKSAHLGLELAQQQLNEDMLKEATKIVANCQHIMVFGVGGASGPVIQDAQIRLSRLNVQANAYSDVHLQRIMAATANEKTVILAVSHTGCTEDIVRSVEVAMSYGAKSVAITRPESPLSRLCNVTLGADIPEDMDIFFSQSASRLAHLAIVDLLAISVARFKGQEVTDLLARIDEHNMGHNLTSRYTPPKFK